MEHFLGIFFTIVAIIFTTILSLLYPKIKWPLFAALFLRLVFSFIHFYVAPLPEGSSDAIVFEKIAWEFSNNSSTLVQGNPPNFYSKLIGYIYFMTDRSPLMIQIINTIASTLTVFIVWLTALELWNKKAALKAAWLMTIYPTVILYATLTLREALFTLMLVTGVLFTVKLIKKNKIRYFFLSSLSFLIASFFHGAAILVLVFIILLAIKRGFVGICLNKDKKHSILAIFLVAFLFFIGTQDFNFNKIGKLSSVFNIELLQDRLTRRQTGSAQYPDYLNFTAGDAVVKIPIRVMYFLFSPTPFDIKSFKDAFGLFDALIYLVFMALLFKNRKLILSRPELRVVLYIFFILVISFTMGTANYGTGIRHRAKIAALLIILISNFIPSKKKVK